MIAFLGKCKSMFCLFFSSLLFSPSPLLQQVPTTNLLFILLTNPAWLGFFDPPTSPNPLCPPRSALHHLPTPVTLKRHTHLPPPLRGTHHTRLEIGWGLLPSIPTRGSLSMGLCLPLTVFMLPSTTAGEYGGLR